MPEEVYVARIPMKYSPGKNRDRNNQEIATWLYPGDELPKEMSEEELLVHRQTGSAVPKSVWEALHAAENALEKAREAQEAAQAEVTKQVIRSSA